MSVPLATTLVGLLTLSLGPSLAYAQSRPSDRPYRALFGRGHQGTSGQTLHVSATLTQAAAIGKRNHIGQHRNGRRVISNRTVEIVFNFPQRTAIIKRLVLRLQFQRFIKIRQRRVVGI